MAEAEKPDLTNLTVQLLSAYVSNNTLPSSELAGLIKTTREALEGDKATIIPAEEFVPAVSARKSLASPDHILSMIDGKPYKSLKRHISTKGLTPDEYRARYKLPSDYPMVAPSYSEQRRQVARRLGLGRKKAPAAPTNEGAAAPASPTTAATTTKNTAPRKAKSAAAAAPTATSSTATKTSKPAKGRARKLAANKAGVSATPKQAAPVVSKGRKAAGTPADGKAAAGPVEPSTE